MDNIYQLFYLSAYTHQSIFCIYYQNFVDKFNSFELSHLNTVFNWQFYKMIRCRFYTILYFCFHLWNNFDNFRYFPFCIFFESMHNFLRTMHINTYLNQLFNNLVSCLHSFFSQLLIINWIHIFNKYIIHLFLNIFHICL